MRKKTPNVREELVVSEPAKNMSRRALTSCSGPTEALKLDPSSPSVS